jgi:hypothetical protein
MKLLKWENINPTLRSLLNPDSDRWSVKAILRFIGFFILAPLYVILTIWAIITDTKWDRLGTGLEKLILLLAGIIGWAFGVFRSMTGVELLLVVVAFLLMQISSRILALHETINEWRNEWQSQQPDQSEYEE